MVDITIQGGFPRGVLLGVGGLVLLTIGIAGMASRDHLGHVEMPATYALSSIDLAFKDLPNGGVQVIDASDGRLVSTVEPETGGFLRGINARPGSGSSAGRAAGRDLISLDAMGRWAIVYRGSADARELRSRSVRVDEPKGLRALPGQTGSDVRTSGVESR